MEATVTFVIGEVYDNHKWTGRIRILSRTSKTVTIAREDGSPRRCKIFVVGGMEMVQPFKGGCSFGVPMVSAKDLVIMEGA